jgi:hypothetical protein
MDNLTFACVTAAYAAAENISAVITIFKRV